MITAEGLSKDARLPRGRFGRSGAPVRVVDQVSIQIAAGQVIGIVGHPHSGRTTLGRLLTGRLVPDAGTLTVSGTDVHRLAKRETAQVCQQLQILGDGAQQLPGGRTLVAAALGAASAAGAARGEFGPALEPGELLAQVGLDPDLGQARLGALTPRQRRLVAAARVVALRPSLVVLDDPVGSGRDEDSELIRRLMLRLREEQGAALVLVGSSLDDVPPWCDRVLVMYLGSVMEVLEPSEIPDAALHPYTHALISAADPGAFPARLALKGDPPEPGDRPSGCVFRTRCFRAQERCADEVPQLTQPLGATHPVACHFPELPARGSQPADVPPPPADAVPGRSPEPTGREFAEG